MNPFEHLKVLFAGHGRNPGPYSAKIEPVNPIPAVPKPEPSCFAKGVAELLKRGEGWKVSKRQPTTGTSYHGDYSYWDVWLAHQQSGVQIRLSEFFTRANVVLDSVGANGETKIYGSHLSNPDGDLIESTILAHPYPALKTRLDKQAKNDATREAKVKAVEKLGCPVPRLVTITPGQNPLP